jgi:hypothetical protein
MVPRGSSYVSNGRGRVSNDESLVPRGSSYVSNGRGRVSCDKSLVPCDN